MPKLVEARITEPFMNDFHASPRAHVSSIRSRNSDQRVVRGWASGGCARSFEAPSAASRTKDTYLQAHYHRLRAHRGHAKATTAVAHSVCSRPGIRSLPARLYVEPGGLCCARRDPERTMRRLVAQLEKLGQPASSNLPPE